MDVVDLIVNGASLRQVARHFKIDTETARLHYTAGLARLIDTSVDRSLALREEVTARQRELILANMARAKAGDRAAPPSSKEPTDFSRASGDSDP